MSYQTKILLYDLDLEIANILRDLKTFQGEFETLLDRLTTIDIALFSGDTKTVIKDLIDAYNNDFKGSMGERIRLLEEITYASAEEVNTQESFEYDEEGNVVKHISTGDREFVVDYIYKKDGSGEIQSSVKTYNRINGDAIKIEKTYTYENTDIVGIKTETTIIPYKASEES